MATLSQSDLDDVLIAAARVGDADTVVRLLNRGADIHSRDDWPLQLAAEKGCVETVTLLLGRGAKLNAFALSGGAASGVREVLAKLLEAGGAKGRVGLATKALGAATEKGHTDIVELLLTHCTDLTAKLDELLERAAIHGRTAIASLLIERGANVNAGQSAALVSAAQNGHVDTVRLLLDCGANQRERDDEVIKAAAFGGMLPTVAFLLQRCAYPASVLAGIRAAASRKKHTEIVAMIDSYRDLQMLAAAKPVDLSAHSQAPSTAPSPTRPSADPCRL